MKKPFLKIVLILSVVLLSLASCGTPVCVMGFGQCEMGASTATPTPTASSMSLSAAPNPITINTSLTLTVSGGTAPYTYSIVSPGGGSMNPIAATTSTTATYAAPATAQSVTLQVVDSLNASATVDVTIN